MVTFLAAIMKQQTKAAIVMIAAIKGIALLRCFKMSKNLQEDLEVREADRRTGEARREILATIQGGEGESFPGCQISPKWICSGAYRGYD